MSKIDTQKTDPVCGMMVDSESARSSSYQSQDYYFCSESCQLKFENDPAAVLAKAAQREAKTHEDAHGGHSCCSHGAGKSEGTDAAGSTPAYSKAIYTCPMHPQVEQVGPGDCPVCGMDLEPPILGRSRFVGSVVDTCNGTDGRIKSR